MTSLEYHNFNINRILLIFIGLWPYRRSFLSRIQLITLDGILITYIIFQVRNLVLAALFFYIINYIFTVLTTRRTPEIVLKILSSTMFFLVTATKYTSFFINGDSLKNLLESLQNICDKLKDKNEIAIINKYGYNGKRYTSAILLLGVFNGFLFLLSQNWLYIYRTFIYSVNKSLHISEFFVTEYFIDQEKYYYLIRLHLYAAYCVGTASLVATGTYLITYVQHICGMLSIASYRIEQALMTDISGQYVLKTKDQICTEIIHAVDIHRKAVELIFGFFNRFEKAFFCLITFGTTSLIFNLLIIMTCTDIQQLVPPVIMLLAEWSYLFISNYIAQQVTDHNEYVFVTVYNVQWYMAPVQIQKMILFLLQKSAKAVHLVIGGIMVASMETAASVLKISISYCTVIYSTLQTT